MEPIDKNLYYTPKVHVTVMYPTLKSAYDGLEHGIYPDDIKYIEIRSKDLLIKLFDLKDLDFHMGRCICYCINKKCFVALWSEDIEKVKL